MANSTSDSSWAPNASPVRSYSATNQNLPTDTPVDASGGATVTTHLSVANNDTINQAPERITQQKILPTAIVTRFFGNLVSFSGVLHIPFIVTNGTSTLLTTSIVDNANRPILAIPQISIYIGPQNIDQISDSNQWPTAAVGGGNFPVYFNPFDYGQVSGADQVARVTCRNNTGSDQQVFAIVQWKVLTVPSPTSSTSST